MPPASARVALPRLPPAPRAGGFCGAAAAAAFVIGF